jgi:hypothetical protein
MQEGGFHSLCCSLVYGAWTIGYSDFHNFMRFTSKKMLNNILKNVC